MNDTLGKRIAALRREKSMKQDELAEKLGVTPQAVSKWENDQTCPDISLLPALAAILGVSVDELLSGKKEAEPIVKFLPAEERKELKDMMLRIIVNEKSGNQVRINLPLALIKIAIDSGLNLSQISDNDALQGIDLRKILELVNQGAIGNLVEVESTDGDTVRIFAE